MWRWIRGGERISVLRDRPCPFFLLRSREMLAGHFQLSSPRRRGPITIALSMTRKPCSIDSTRRTGPRLRGDDTGELVALVVTFSLRAHERMERPHATCSNCANDPRYGRIVYGIWGHLKDEVERARL